VITPQLGGADGETQEQRSPAGDFLSVLAGRWLDLLAAALVLATVVVNHRGYYNDDAYITFRYADNLLAGEGLVFNPGERVLGTTAPAYAILLALFALPLRDVAVAGLVLGWAGFAVMGLGLWLLTEQLRRGAGLCGTLAVGLMGLDLCMKFQFGMETTLATGLIFLVIWQHVSRRQPLLMGALLAVALLLRPDAIFVAVVLTLASAVERRISWRALIGLSLPLGLWALVAWMYYGSPVPTSVGAKYVLGQHQIGSPEFLATLFSKYYEWYWGRWGLLWIALLGLIVGLLCRVPAVTLLVSWITLHFVAFAVSGVEGFDWYYIPIFAVLYTGVGLWALWLMRWIDRPWFDALSRLVLTAGAGACLVAALSLRPEESAGWAEHQSSFGVRQRAIAEHINALADPEDTVTTIECGVLGYHVRCRILDLRGLVSPEALEHIAQDDYSWWTRLTPPPEYVVVHSPPWRIEGWDYDFIIANYRLAFEMDGCQLLKRLALRDPDMSLEDLLAHRVELIEREDDNALGEMAQLLYAEGRFADFVDTIIDLRRFRPPSPEQLSQLLMLIEQRIVPEERRPEWFESLAPAALETGDAQVIGAVERLASESGLEEIARRMREHGPTAEVEAGRR
jgi:hypothetical protein